VAGTTHWCAGEYVQARDDLERALALFQAGRDDDLAFRFGHDVGVTAMVNLAIVSWSLDDVAQGSALLGGADMRMASIPHVGTRAYGKYHTALVHILRGDFARAGLVGSEVARLGLEHELPFWRMYGSYLENWSISQGRGLADGLSGMRYSAELMRQQKALVFDGLLKIALSETEARAGELGGAIATLDAGLTSSDQTGQRAFDAFLHRARGDILLKRDPEDPAPAEEAYQTAIAIAQQQGARSYELLASLSLAKLYQSTGRPAEAHAVLAPALEGFAPTPEMPEIAEAPALLERTESGAKDGANGKRR
jgi:predicted ATPase